MCIRIIIIQYNDCLVLVCAQWCQWCLGFSSVSHAGTVQLLLVACVPPICLQWWRDDALPLWNWCFTPLEVHEYNEGFCPLHVHRIETEHARVVCESQQVEFFSGEEKMPDLVSQLHHNPCCRWVHLICIGTPKDATRHPLCVRASSVSVSSGMLVYSMIPMRCSYNLK